MVQPFDARRLALSGEVVPVAEKVGSFLDYGFFSASSNGVLVYKSGVGLDYQLTWFDRQGRVLAKVAEPGRYNTTVWHFHRTEGASLFPALIPKTRPIGMCGCSTKRGTPAETGASEPVTAIEPF